MNSRGPFHVRYLVPFHVREMHRGRLLLGEGGDSFDLFHCLEGKVQIDSMIIVRDGKLNLFENLLQGLFGVIVRSFLIFFFTMKRKYFVIICCFVSSFLVI